MVSAERHLVYLGLGSNLPPRSAHLAAALAELAARGLKILRRSPVYQTKPWGGVPQPDFLNLALAAETELSPLALLALLKRLERDLGRKPTCVWGPRVLDIDILLYDELTFWAKGLTIPHREISNRAFVLIPLLDIAPGLVLPGGLSAAAALSRLPEAERAGVRPYEGEA